MKIKLKMIRMQMDKKIMKITTKTQNQKKTDSSEKEKRYITYAYLLIVANDYSSILEAILQWNNC